MNLQHNESTEGEGLWTVGCSHLYGLFDGAEVRNGRSGFHVLYDEMFLQESVRILGRHVLLDPAAEEFLCGRGENQRQDGVGVT